MSLSASDLFLSPDLTEEHARQYLGSIGFRDPGAADLRLQMLADLVVRETLASVADDLLAALAESANPDAALTGFFQYVMARTSRTMFLEYLRDDPQALHVLAEVLGASPLLSEILIRNTEYLHWLIAHVDRRASSILDDEEDGDERLLEPPGVASTARQLDALKRLNRRHLLRIAARDLLGRETLQSATAQLSDLASVTTERVLQLVSARHMADNGVSGMPGAFAVLATGRLGGLELGYEPDIELFYVYRPHEPEDPSSHEFFRGLGEALTAALVEETDESYLYQVAVRSSADRAGGTAHAWSECEARFARPGPTPERMALTKARPIAGDSTLGQRVLDLIHAFVYRDRADAAQLDPGGPTPAIEDDTRNGRVIALGREAMRQVDWLTQALQLAWGGERLEIRQPNTLAALDAARQAGLLAEAAYRDLARTYAFLRTVEQRLRLAHPIVASPESPPTPDDAAAAIEATARRLGFDTTTALEAELEALRNRVRDVYRELVL